MQIYVCVKHVPDSGALIELDGDTSFVEGNVKFIPSPFDEYGIEEALTLNKKHGGEVVIVCAANSNATSSIRAALAMGATRALHIVTEGQFTNSTTIAAAVAEAITNDGNPDIVFTGKQSIDSEGSQFPYRLAHALKMPVVNDVTGLEITEAVASVTREIGGGIRQQISAAMPCVIGATRGLNEPRYPKLPDIMKAKKKPIQEIPVENLTSASTPSPILEHLEMVPERSGAKMLEGDVSAQIEELVRTLREEERVL